MYEGYVLMRLEGRDVERRILTWVEGWCNDGSVGLGACAGTLALLVPASSVTWTYYPLQY